MSQEVSSSPSRPMQAQKGQRLRLVGQIDIKKIINNNNNNKQTLFKEFSYSKRQLLHRKIIQ